MLKLLSWQQHNCMVSSFRVTFVNLFRIAVIQDTSTRKFGSPPPQCCSIYISTGVHLRQVNVDKVKLHLVFCFF